MSGKRERVALLVAVVCPVVLGAQQTNTRSVTDHYLDLTLNQRYDELASVCADDAVFFDPTGDVFQGPVAEGPITGAQTIVDVQRGWGLARARFDIDVSFTVGEYSLYRGTYHAGYANTTNDVPIPFVTVPRAHDGRIAERTDFGEYIESFGLGDGFDPNTAMTRERIRSRDGGGGRDEDGRHPSSFRIRRGAGFIRGSNLPATH